MEAYVSKRKLLSLLIQLEKRDFASRFVEKINGLHSAHFFGEGGLHRTQYGRFCSLLPPVGERGKCVAPLRHIVGGALCLLLGKNRISLSYKHGKQKAAFPNDFRPADLLNGEKQDRRYSLDPCCISIIRRSYTHDEVVWEARASQTPELLLVCES